VGDDLRSVCLQEFKRLYRDTGESIWVWYALDAALNLQPPVPPPDWCLRIIARDAKTLSTKVRTLLRDKASTEAATRAYRELLKEMVLLRLGPTQGGKNAFARLVADNIAMLAAYDRDCDPEATDVEVVSRHLGKRKSADRAEEIVREGRRRLNLPKPRRKQKHRVRNGL
jgi:hypothetical protein